MKEKRNVIYGLHAHVYIYTSVSMCVKPLTLMNRSFAYDSPCFGASYQLSLPLISYYGDIVNISPLLSSNYDCMNTR